MSKLLTSDELCEFLQVGRKFIYQCRKSGMPYLKLGNKLVRYDLNAVLRWLETENFTCKGSIDND